MTDPPGYLYPPAVRLRKSREFRSVRENGRKYNTSHFIVFVKIKIEGPSRLGVTASRRIGGAVQRNRVKRLVREFFRLQQGKLPQAVDISIVAKKGSPQLNLHRVCRELEFLRKTDTP